MTSESTVRRRIGRVPGVLLIVAGLVIALSGGSALAQTLTDNARMLTEFEDAKADLVATTASQRRVNDLKREIAAQAQAAREAERAQDEHMASQGFDAWGGGLYWRSLSGDEITCGYRDCGGIQVVAIEGCPDSLYAEVAWMDGDVNIGWANDRSAGIPAGGSAVLMFDKLVNGGEGYRLTELNCR